MPVWLAHRHDGIAKFDDILLLQLNELLPCGFSSRLGIVSDDDEFGHKESCPEICNAIVAH